MAPIKKIKTPFEGIEVELKEWITGGEYEEIQKPITDVKMLIDTLGTAKGEINAGDAIRKSTETAIKIVVVSVDGKKENILERLRSLRKEDYLFVLDEIDKIVKRENFPKPV